jgi:hypothetical protein
MQLRLVVAPAFQIVCVSHWLMASSFCGLLPHKFKGKTKSNNWWSLT